MEQFNKKKVIRTPVFSTEVTLRAYSSTINNDTQNDEANEASDFDRTENELNYEMSTKVCKHVSSMILTFAITSNTKDLNYTKEE